MEDFEDFETPNDATESADPFGGYEPPQEESYAPQPQPPPVQPARDPYDDTPEWIYDVQDIGEYTQKIIKEVGTRFWQTVSEERLRERIESAEELARELHNGKDGVPGYDELVNTYAVPFLRDRPALRQLVLSQGDPAAAAYLVAFCCRFPALISEVVARNGRIDKTILQSTNFRPTIRGQGSRRSQPSGKVNYENWDNESFIAELDRFKLSPEGE